MGIWDSHIYQLLPIGCEKAAETRQSRRILSRAHQGSLAAGLLASMDESIGAG